MIDTAGSRWRRARPPRAAMLAITVGMLLLLVAACGSSSPSSSSSPSTGSSGSTATGSVQSQQLAFAECMRSHGVTDFPDPNPSGGFGDRSQAESNPNYQTARGDCHHLLPYGGVPPSNQGKGGTNNSLLLQVAQCMRAHGVPNYPDPSANGASGTNSNVGALQQAGVDVNSPQFQAASQICNRLVTVPSTSAGGGS